jgi:hypothetical protein
MEAWSQRFVNGAGSPGATAGEFGFPRCACMYAELPILGNDESDFSRTLPAIDWSGLAVHHNLKQNDPPVKS